MQTIYTFSLLNYELVYLKSFKIVEILDPKGLCCFWVFFSYNLNIAWERLQNFNIFLFPVKRCPNIFLESQFFFQQLFIFFNKIRVRAAWVVLICVGPTRISKPYWKKCLI